ncbi:MAG: HEAT repeat domain-containing protein [Planctomycetota bacterium]|jgi:hypothetical protein
MQAQDDQLARLEELARSESFSSPDEHLVALREMVDILIGLPWEKWTEDECADIEKFKFFLLMEPDDVENHVGALSFRDAVVEAARSNPAVSRLVLTYPSHWTFLELKDLKQWVAARPRGVGIELADRFSPFQARNIIPPPNVATQLEVLEDIIRNFPEARAAAAQAYGRWLSTRAEAGESAAGALRRTVSAIANILSDDGLEPVCARYLLELALMPVIEEESVFAHVSAWVDDNPRLRASLSFLVSWIFLDDAAPVLRKLAADEIPDLREEAINALIRIGEEGHFMAEDMAEAYEIIDIAKKHNVARDLLEKAGKTFTKPPKI